MEFNIFNQTFSLVQVLNFLGTIAGLFYIYYQFKVSVKLWVWNLIMSFFYIAINLIGGLYALTGLYIYYVLAATYGIYVWTHRKQEDTQKEQPITHIPLKTYFVLIPVIAVLTVSLSFVLKFMNEAHILWADSLTTSLSIVSMWLLAQKYAEQWVFWIVVDVINCAIYYILGPEYYLSSALFGFYAIVAVFGYFYWLKLMKKQDVTPKMSA